MKNLFVNGSAIQSRSRAIRFITRRSIQLAAILLSCLCTSGAVVLAQDQQRITEGQASVSIVAAITSTGARFTAPKEIGEMRLEGFSSSGEKIFDSAFQRGNILDWSPKKGGQAPPPDGDYLLLLTLRDLTGRLSRQQTVASLGSGKVVSMIADPTRITAAQRSVLASNSVALENLEWLTLRREGTSAALTTHDGSDSQITSTNGALTFRTGELFAGKDQEQMRITPDGRVGIGTANPQATLDVAGDVRARGIRFEDGTVLSSATGATKTGPDGTDQPLVDGTGTTNRVTKWTNGPAGTLGDSALTETGGKLALGTSVPNFELTLFGNDIGVQLISPGTGALASDGFRFGIDSTNKAFLFNQEPTDMFFGTSATERMRILAGGNVGIGTTAPLARLHAAGTSSNAATPIAIIQSSGSQTPLSFRTGAVEGARLRSDSSGNLVLATLNGGSENIHLRAGDDTDTDLFIQSSNGNVGIGTLTPANKLDVAGDINTSTQFNIGGQRVLTSLAGTTTDNVFAGVFAGQNNTTGIDNSFFGVAAGGTNVSGSNNTFVGRAAGFQNQTGSDNVFVGSEAGNNNNGGSQNTIIGRDADVTNTGLTNATAIGYRTRVSQSNSLILGSVDGAGTNDTSVGIGTTAPTHRLTVSVGAPDVPVLSSAQVGIYRAGGAFAIARDTTSDVEALFGADENGALFGSMTNHGIRFRTNNNTKMFLAPSGNVSIGSNTDHNTKLYVNGAITLEELVTPGTDSLCFRMFNSEVVLSKTLAVCSSSIRYKTDVRGFRSGLDLLNRLRPVSFRWKDSGRADVGLVAEEVESVEPLLVTYNKRGEVEGVKYDRIGVVLLNAVREQQAQIKAQEQQLLAKDRRIANLAARVERYESGLAKYESSLARYESRLATLERSARIQRRTRPITARTRSTGSLKSKLLLPSKTE